MAIPHGMARRQRALGDRPAVSSVGTPRGFSNASSPRVWRHRRALDVNRAGTASAPVAIDQQVNERSRVIIPLANTSVPFPATSAAACAGSSVEIGRSCFRAARCERNVHDIAPAGADPCTHRRDGPCRSKGAAAMPRGFLVRHLEPWVQHASSGWRHTRRSGSVWPPNISHAVGR